MNPDLDSMLDLETASKWLGISQERLLPKCKGRKPSIPAFWLNRRVVRFHPRTIISKLAADAGVAPEVIAASLALNAGKQRNT